MLGCISNAEKWVARNRSINIKFTLKNLLKMQKRAKVVELGLRDNTIRVSLEIQAKNCHPFFTTKPTAEAVGFGLSLTRDLIVQQHHGTLKVESEMRLSTDFIINLPKL
ncbi:MULTISPECIES: ATP-binding protein [unclassified Microcoleus]|uniref:ATP-binding protein n=1 Tax=unclassified Microcoleus TaxID=2642155 RepID=UPI002FD57713